MGCAGKHGPNTSRQVSWPVAHCVDFLRGCVVQALWVWGWVKSSGARSEPPRWWRKIGIWCG